MMPYPPLSRRWFLAAALSGVAMPAGAEAPQVSLRPKPRPFGRSLHVKTPDAEALIAAANLGGRVSFAVADATTGQILTARDADVAQPPASVAKTVTTLFALARLGPGYRFETSLVATGPVQGGKLAGDLVLAGSGDPTLTTDALGDLAAALASRGVNGVSGKYRYWGGALPFIAEIAADQPAHVGYNPSICGLNLNFNRVHFEWKRAASGYAVTMDARAERYVPPVRIATMEVVNRDLPVYTYAQKNGTDRWTVAAQALGGGGSRWLPVRRPDAYAAEVFQTLARGRGIALPRGEKLAQRPAGTVLASARSEPLPVILRDMLKYSTNVTAESLGLAASGAGGLNSSGQAMSAWARDRFGLGAARFVDHSGLGSASRISATEMLRVLVAPGVRGQLAPLLKEVGFRDARGKEVRNHPVTLRAKTGTLNFVSALAGYAEMPGGRVLAFAIFCADPARRDAVAMRDREAPPGGKSWVRRARGLQQQLVEAWADAYGV